MVQLAARPGEGLMWVATGCESCFLLLPNQVMLISGSFRLVLSVTRCPVSFKLTMALWSLTTHSAGPVRLHAASCSVAQLNAPTVPPATAADTNAQLQQPGGCWTPIDATHRVAANPTASLIMPLVEEFVTGCHKQ